MLENGYIRFVSTNSGIDDNGDPIIFEDEVGDYIPCCLNGTENLDNYSDDNGHYSKNAYTVHIQLSDLPSRKVKLYDRGKNHIGDFFVRTLKRSPFMRTIEISVE